MYIYDAEGNRVAKGTLTSFSCDLTQNGFTTTTQYIVGQSGEQVTAVDGSGNWKRSNVYAAGALLATYDINGVHFDLSDALGNKRVQVNATGTVEQTCQSLPFGDQLSCSGTGSDASKLHYTGKERDSESGNDYFGARYLSSNVGRFLSPDWSKNPQGVPYADYTNPQSLNLYAYVNNNPLTGVDKDGHDGSCSANPGLCSSIRDSVAKGGSIAAGTAAFNSQQQNTPSQNASANNKSTAISKAFTLGAQYGEQSIGADDQKPVLVRHVGFTDNVQILGDTLDENKASSGWEDPITSFHGGAKSYYFGGIKHLFGMNAGHVAAGAGKNAGPGLESHHDRFGPLNPIHWFFEALPSLVINTRSSAVAQPYTCSLNGGCAAQ